MQDRLDGDFQVAATPDTEEPGWYDPGVIEHQGVARLQQPRQIPDRQILQPGLRPDHQEPRGFPGDRRSQGDTAFGQIKIKIAYEHGWRMRRLVACVKRPLPVPATGLMDKPGRMGE